MATLFNKDLVEMLRKSAFGILRLPKETVTLVPDGIDTSMTSEEFIDCITCKDDYVVAEYTETRKVKYRFKNGDAITEESYKLGTTSEILALNTLYLNGYIIPGVVSIDVDGDGEWDKRMFFDHQSGKYKGE